MDFQCYLCFDRFFADNKSVIDHLKSTHQIKEKIQLIKCTVRETKCGKYFQTFSGLSRHVLACLSNREINEMSEQINNVELEDNPIYQNHQKSFIFNDSSNASYSNSNDTFIYNEVVSQIHDAGSQNANSSFIFNSSNLNIAGGERGTENVQNDPAMNYFRSLLQLNMNESTLNSIFSSTEKLLMETKGFCHQQIKNHGDPLENFDVAINVVMTGLQKFDTSHKRKMFLESQKLHVKSMEFGIGTHWATKRDKHSGQMMPVREQSTFSYFSPLEVIEKLFKRKHVCDAYFNYNETSKHNCEPNIYQDFCCGTVFRDIELFRKHPDSLQLQFFIDGVEICSALKTKTTLHSQVAIYMTIRNMPPQYAYNMGNIHLICLVNENDLKKAETNYTNILELIVAEKHLESS